VRLSPSREADGRSASQAVPRLLWNPQFHYLVLYIFLATNPNPDTQLVCLLLSPTVHYTALNSRAPSRFSGTPIICMYVILWVLRAGKTCAKHKGIWGAEVELLSFLTSTLNSFTPLFLEQEGG